MPLMIKLNRNIMKVDLCLDNGHFITVINTDLVIPKYLYYVMLQLDLNNYNEGTTIPSLRRETLYNLEFDIPPIDEQKKIISCLKPLEEKIVNNNEINNNLVA